MAILLNLVKSCCPLLCSHTYQHRCLDTLHSDWNISTPLFDRNSTECHIPSYSYIALLSAALSEQHPCQNTGALVYPLLLSSQDFVDADVDQALIPPSIFAPEGTL